jgi:uncharacterized membrane protein YjgN (DUF898 family)
MAATTTPVDAGDISPALQIVRFTGRGTEYFRLWLSNLFLSVATLGLYSPWAKVRRLQFFYRHTRAGGAGFEYHGQPLAILRGRIIAVTLFSAYSLVASISPIGQLAAFALLGVVMPWLLVRSLRFRLENTSYRGIRFGFAGSTADAYRALLVWPVLSILSLGLAVPAWQHRLQEFQFGNASCGQSRLRTRMASADFYAVHVHAWLLVVGLFVAAFVVFQVAMVAVGAILAMRQAPARPEAREAFGRAVGLVAGMSMVVVYLLIFTGARAYILARTRNLIWSRATLDGRAFLCSVSPRRLFVIMCTNLVLTILTLGLYRPFGQVRLAAYLAEEFVILPHETPTRFENRPGGRTGALGDEAADAFDVDIGF